MANEKVSSVVRSWSRRAPLAINAGVPQDYVKRLAREDIEKAMKGGTPMTGEQAGLTFRSIIDKKGFLEKEQDSGFFDIPGNVIGDIKEIATTFLPALAHEVTRLPERFVDFNLLLTQDRPDIREKYGMSENKDGGIFESLRNVAKMPIVNYTPGLFTAANLTSAEGRKTIMENPLITGLDVLPATKILAKSSAAARGVTAAKTLEQTSGVARQATVRGVLTKLENKKYVNINDVKSLPNTGLREIINHAEDATTEVKVPSRVAKLAMEELNKREAGIVPEPHFLPTETVMETVTRKGPDPDWVNPLSKFDEVESITPEEVSAQKVILENLVKTGKDNLVDVGNDIQRLDLPANDFGPGMSHYLSLNKNGRVNAFLSLSRDASNLPVVDMLWRNKRVPSTKGVSKSLYAAADSDGWNIAEASASGMTDAGRAARANYLGLPRTAPMIDITEQVAREVPITPAAIGSVDEALALGQPMKALSRATGFSPRVIKPLAERLGVTEGMRVLYKAVGGTLPRKYQPQLEAELKRVGDSLSEVVKDLPAERQGSFYRDVMAAAQESADTIKAANLPPEVLAGVNILRNSTDELVTQLVNAEEVIPVPLPEGGTALFASGSAPARAWQKIERVIQDRPKDFTKNSPIEKHVAWQKRAEKARATFDEALDKNAPLAFQHLIEQKILNHLAITMMAPERAVELAERAANVMDKIKQGKYVNKEDIASMSNDTLEYVKGFAEDSSKGVKVPSKVYTNIMKELQLRQSTGSTGPIDIMSLEMEQAIVDKIASGDYLQYITKEALDEIISSSTAFWRQLKSQGYEPVPVPYIHKSIDITKPTFIQPVPEGMSIGDVNRFRTAVFDFKPTQKDLSVALSKEATDVLRYEATKEFHSQFVDKLSRSTDEVMEEYAMLYTDLDRLQLREQILKDYVPYDASLDHPFRATWDAGIKDTGARLLPRPVSVQLHNLVKRDQLPVKGVVDRVNKVFRFAVLTSPRHVSHIAGGGLTQMLMRDPMAITEIANGYRMVRDKTLPIDLPQGIDGFTTAEVWNYTGGRTIGRLANEGHVRFRNFEEFLANSLKATDYLFNKKKQLKKGMSDDYAHNAGIEASAKALAIFEDMSPFERQYIRTYVPFYGFTRHLTRYLLSYPADHPYKAAILSQITKREYEDWNTGFPRKWNQLFFMGKPNAEGDAWGIDFKSLNPFRTAYNNFTPLGILSQSTPWIAAPLQMAGFNTVSGSGELYPDMAYDSATGSLTTKRSDTAVKFFSAFIPQIGTADYFLQFSADSRRMARDNPEAFRQKLFTTVGIPFEPKHVNIPTEIARTQKNQLRVAQIAVQDALNGGSTKEIRRYNVVPFQGELLPANVVADYIDQLQGFIQSSPELQEAGVVPKILNPRR